MLSLPAEWKTESLIVRDVTQDDAGRLRAIFNACAPIEIWDPTFKPESAEGFANLIHMSADRESGAGRAFQMQALIDSKTGEIAGYYHLYFGVPRSDRVFISMFVIHPDSQSHQFGKEVVTGLVKQIKRLGGYKGILLQVYLKNWPALRFWFLNGFDAIREYRGDKSLTPDGHASLILERKLGR